LLLRKFTASRRVNDHNTAATTAATTATNNRQFINYELIKRQGYSSLPTARQDRY
jgi:hypothetical protein